MPTAGEAQSQPLGCQRGPKLLNFKIKKLQFFLRFVYFEYFLSQHLAFSLFSLTSVEEQAFWIFMKSSLLTFLGLFMFLNICLPQGCEDFICFVENIV